MTAQNFDSQSEAVIYLIENRETPQATTPQETPKAPLLSTPPSVEIRDSVKLSPSLDVELQHFLRGQPAPMVALLLSDIPRKNPTLYLAATALHDT